MDLDKSGHGYQRVKTYLGPTLGWIDELVQPTTDIRVGGTYKVQPGDSLILVDVPNAVTIELPDVVAWMQQPQGRPATSFDKSITVKDLGGNAANFNIAITPFGQQSIDNLQQSTLVTTARATIKLIPLIDMSGWTVFTAATEGGGSSGGGDVYKAGNNTFTGTNTFQGVTTAPTQLDTDNSTKVATTAWITAKGYLVSSALTPYALIASPTFTGNPQITNTPAPGDNTHSIADTAFVTAAVGAVGHAPMSAPYVTFGVDATLTNERVLTTSATITVDTSVAGQIKLNSSAGGGNVSNVATPVALQYARWVTSTTIEGIPVATVLSDIGAQPLDAELTALAGLPSSANTMPYFTGPGAAQLTNLTAAARTVLAGTTTAAMLSTLGGQPLDGDLTAIAAAAGTNTIYYRSAADTWSPVTFSGLSFSGGVLTVTAGGGNVSNSGTPTAGQLAVWTDATHIQGVAAAYAPLADPVFTGDPKAPTPLTADNDTSIATTAFVKAQGYAPIASPSFTGTPLSITPSTSDSSTTIATTAFVKNQAYISANTTTTITVGYTFGAFNAGTKSSGTFTPAPASGNYQYYTNNGAHTLGTPTSDCAIDILVTNGATAGAITFAAGYIVGPNTGDPYALTSGNKFIISIRRINATPTYTIKALQ